MLIKVMHVSTKDAWDKPKDGSSTWLDYWFKYSKVYYPNHCPDCNRIVSNNDLVGAHVKKVDSNDYNIYIVPVCRSCNSSGASNYHSFVCDERLLVPANKNRL